MEQKHSNIQTRKGKHLNRNEHILIEEFFKAGKSEAWLSTLTQLSILLA